MEDIGKGAHKHWWLRRMRRFDQSYLPPAKPDYDIDLNREND